MTERRYELLRPLGSGGMAEVFLAKQTGVEGFEKLVVIKRILPQHAADPQFISMLKDEARIAAQLNHPNIAQAFELGRDDRGDLFLALEYVHGVDGAQLLKRAQRARRPLPVEDVVRIVCGVLEGLAYAHALTDARGVPLGVVHRDVSLSNVLVSFDGVVKLIDFGIARARTRLTTTRPGVAVGKPTYMAPEQFTGGPVDARTDVFSTGVLLSMLLTGRPPWGDERVDLTRERPDLPPPIAALVERAVREDPRDRPQSAGEMQTALERALVDARVVASASHLGQTVRDLFSDELAERTARLDQRTKTDSQVVLHEITDAPTQLAARVTSSLGSADLWTAEATTTAAVSAADASTATLSAPAKLEHRRAPRALWATAALLGIVLVVVAAALALTTRTSQDPVPTLAVEAPPPAPPAGPPAPVAVLAPVPAPEPAAVVFDAGVVALAVEAPPAAAKPRTPTPPPPKRARARTGTLLIESVPSAAAFVDGAAVGSTPLELQLPPGPHEIELRARGHEPWRSGTRVAEGRVSRVRWTF